MGYQILGNLLGCIEFLLLNQSLAWLPLQLQNCCLFSFSHLLEEENRGGGISFYTVRSQQKVRQAWEMENDGCNFEHSGRMGWNLFSFKSRISFVNLKKRSAYLHAVCVFGEKFMLFAELSWGLVNEPPIKLHKWDLFVKPHKCDLLQRTVMAFIKVVRGP